MNFQPLIDNLPMILVSIAFLLWAAARFVEAKAKSNPSQDGWDTWAPRLSMASKMYSQAIEWMVQAGAEKWTGAEKLAQLNTRLKGFEEQIEQGNYREALANLTGFYQAAAAKIEKVQGAVHPFAPRPSTVTNQGELGSSQEPEEIGPDSPAQEIMYGQ